MTPSYTIHTGDALAVLRTLPDQSIQTCITSPPYYGLRDYGTGSWEGGDPNCTHQQEQPRYNGPKQTTAQVSGHASQAEKHGRTHCPMCGATRTDSQIGLEDTPEEYVQRLVAVFREIRRVIRDDGTAWVNLGDSYNTGTTAPSKPTHNANVGYWQNADTIGRPRMNWPGLKTKDLCGIPWRVALALQADGWYLRSDIIWAKPNPQPESVTDRPTRSHEYLFLLSKSQKYYYDADSIKEPLANSSIVRLSQPTFDQQTGGPKDYANGTNTNRSTRRTLSNLKQKLADDPTAGRNKRDVWTIPTQPYKEAHFATYPEALVEPCILAGSPPHATVLDPFTGSGTTGAVALRLNRNFVGIELNPQYVEMAERRLSYAAKGLRPPKSLEAPQEQPSLFP